MSRNFPPSHYSLTLGVKGGGNSETQMVETKRLTKTWTDKGKELKRELETWQLCRNDSLNTESKRLKRTSSREWPTYRWRVRSRVVSRGSSDPNHVSGTLHVSSSLWKWEEDTSRGGVERCRGIQGGWSDVTSRILDFYLSKIDTGGKVSI